ncbi:UDP-glucose dehydrogenase family protein [Arthrobacter glacialis]|uniref:UDP-glucose dehydrogenase family protein n=1 Tax=Arthrobacter glacialis TaxID=1664 RepID=UPI000CD3ABB3|nr:UDP-glucose/GDP-mannose dehydrogenase family protein [Arthrobacter glacialis]POH58866.1 UDP-glucose/GDP-mannose dehydrogenase family protein [Arthrobacter glacialis]
MKISVIGAGYLGTVHAATLASMGHHVIGLDTDAARIETLARGAAPFHEPGLAELLQDGHSSGRLTFSTDPARLADADVHFLCVGTPQSRTGNDTDLSFLLSAVSALLPHVRPGAVVVGKSTVPVGTAAIVAQMLLDTGAALAWNPEFLRQGTAVQDSLAPDRLVYGVPSDAKGTQACSMLDVVYAPLLARGTPRLVTNFATAELIKVSANAFLALKLSYVNAVGQLCEQVGADVVQLSQALGLDERIGGRYFHAGVGFGGGCLPKDLRSFRAQAHRNGVESLDEMLSLVDGINADARYHTAEAAVRLCGGSVRGRAITVLGATFKPNTDDIRDSPALDVASQLAAQGAHVTVTDPQAGDHVWLQYPQLTFQSDVSLALRGADMVLLLTQWPQFLSLDPALTAALVQRPVMLDGRNALDAAAWQAAGWEYHGIGRGQVLAKNVPSAGLSQAAA